MVPPLFVMCSLSLTSFVFGALASATFRAPIPVVIIVLHIPCPLSLLLAGSRLGAIRSQIYRAFKVGLVGVFVWHGLRICLSGWLVLLLPAFIFFI